ncbi:MAG: MFS transporter [Acidobacteria bacterium]|nr:MFS transporter [Acidobacteriota bacterium]MCA1637295.1 MFS transporter [Acidobacteriota bacterium]
MLIDITPLKISRDYRLLFFGQLISFFGSMMSFIVVPVQMFQLTESSLMVGLIGIAEFVPMFVLAFVGGVLADAVDRRKMLRLTEVGQTIVTAILLGNSLLPQPQIWILFVCVGIHAGLAGLQRPSFEALIPKIVPLEYMTAVSALNSIRYNVGAILSPIIAGFLVTGLGASWAYLIDLITFIASLIAVWLIRAVPPAADADRPNFESIKKGFRYAMSRQELLGTYLIDINAMLFGMPIALFPAIAAAHGGASVGFLYSAIAVGALIASLTSGWAKKVYRHGLMIAIAAALWGVAIIFFGLAESFWLGLFFLAVAGFFDMISGIFRSTIWNQTIPNHFRGRLAGIEMISYLTGPMLGHAEAGIVAHFFGVKTSIISGGILTVIGTIVLAFLLPKFIFYDGREGIKRKKREEQERETMKTLEPSIEQI